MRIITIIILCFASITGAMDREIATAFTSISQQINDVREQLIFSQKAFIFSKQLNVMRNDVLVLDEILQDIRAAIEKLTPKEITADEKKTLLSRVEDTEIILIQLSEIAS